MEEIMRHLLPMKRYEQNVIFAYILPYQQPCKISAINSISISSRDHNLAILRVCDLFGIVKTWPFQRLYKWPPTNDRGEKGHPAGITTWKSFFTVLPARCRNLERGYLGDDLAGPMMGGKLLDFCMGNPSHNYGQWSKKVDPKRLKKG